MRSHPRRTAAPATTRGAALLLAVASLAACHDPTAAPPAPPSGAWAFAPVVARVEILAAPMPLLYDAPTQAIARDFTAVAYDKAGRVVNGAWVQWSDALNWNPGVQLVRLSPSTVRVSIPYANAAAPVHADGRCDLPWKGIRATVGGVSTLLPVCGTFAVPLSVAQGDTLVPVSGSTVRLPANQRCRLHAAPSGGHGFYDVSWDLDGVSIGEGAAIEIDTGMAAQRTLVVRVSDEGHDIAPWRELAFTLDVRADVTEGCSGAVVAAG